MEQEDDEPDATIGLQHLTVSQALPQGANACFDPVLQESVFECPVHGEIVLPPQVTPCLNTKAFARLKALKQLGICFLVSTSWLAAHVRIATACADQGMKEAAWL